ncbi:MAG: hypothetical protein SXV54_16970 [Chloroflexota bacterium]|nr:hypothetical protein [Chloroflexota bacterium]
MTSRRPNDQTTASEASPPDHQAPRRLSPWNPLDHCRLLWWVLVTPQRLVAYREAYGENADYTVGKWLATTLFFLPYVLPALAWALETLPQEHGASLPFYLGMTIGLVLLWALTGCLKTSYNASLNATSVVFSVTFLLVNTGTGTGSGLLTGIIARTLTYNIVDAYVKPRVGESLRTGHPSWLARGAFAGFALTYVFLIWFSFLGGWRGFR